MTTDLTIRLLDRPGTLADATCVLATAGIDFAGAFGLPVGGVGQFHLVVEDAVRAERALIDAGFEIDAVRPVVAIRFGRRARDGGGILRRFAATGVVVDLVYTTLDGRLVVGGDDLTAIRAVVATRPREGGLGTPSAPRSAGERPGRASARARGPGRRVRRGESAQLQPLVDPQLRHL